MTDNDGINDSPERVMRSIVWDIETGTEPSGSDLALLARYYRSGDIKTERDKRLARSTLQKLAVAKCMCRNYIELGDYNAAALQTSLDLFGQYKVSTIKTYHSQFRKEAIKVIHLEYQLVIIDVISKLFGQKDAIAADSCGEFQHDRTGSTLCLYHPERDDFPLQRELMNPRLTKRFPKRSNMAS